MRTHSARGSRAARHARPRVGRDHALAAERAQLRARGGLREQLRDAARERVRRVRAHEDPTARGADHLGQGAGRGRHHRSAARHRLGRGQAEALEERRHRHERRAPVQGHERLHGHAPDDVDAVLDPELPARARARDCPGADRRRASVERVAPALRSPPRACVTPLFGSLARPTHSTSCGSRVTAGSGRNRSVSTPFATIRIRSRATPKSRSIWRALTAEEVNSRSTRRATNDCMPTG